MLDAFSIEQIAAGFEASTEPMTRTVSDIDEFPIAPRREAQLATRDRFRVFHDFTFSDRLTESGIGFRHRIVDDGGIDFKAVHYDHGNGLVVADVDGDDRYDIYFLTQLGGNQLWRNLGGGRFEDLTERAGVGLTEKISTSAAFADYDNDGDRDLFVTTVRQGNHLFRNDGGGRFRDVTAETGLGYRGHSSAALFFDYDRDGLLDLFVVNVGVYTTDETGRGGYFIGRHDAFAGHLVPERSEASILYRNVGGERFEDVSAEVGLVDTAWSGDASIADFNRDGFPDLYVLNMQGDDRYYENAGGREFVERTAELFPKTGWGAMGIKVFDYNNDGLLDLLTTDMHSDMFKKVGPDEEKAKSSFPTSAAAFVQGGENNIFGNTLYKNLGEARFEEVSDTMGVESYWPWGVSVDDLNADGWDDLFITACMNYPWRYHPNSVLLNNRGETFLDSELILGVEPRRGGRLETPWFEVDCDGTDEGHPTCADAEPGRYTVMGALGSRSSVLFDLDDDGDLDIVTSDFNSPPQVLLSDLSERTAVRFLKVRLAGTRSNRDGIGARVEVRAGGRTLTKVLDGASGYLSHSLLPLYFGLGEAPQVDEVRVLWPSGGEQTVTRPEINRLLTITEQ